MKYLFFDIECANCNKGAGKICEFGYVLTDEKFAVLEQEIYLINPNDVFDWYVAKKILAYKAIEYNRSPDYPHFYPKIQALLTDADTMIFGHTVDSDFKYLNDESRRYNLPYFDCKFYDVKYMYDTYAQADKSSSVSKICAALEIELPVQVHRSVDDAYATMEILKELCKRLEAGAPDLIARYEDCKGETSGGVITTVVGERAKAKRAQAAKENLLIGKNKKRFFRFIRSETPPEKICENELTGKKVSISLHYEYAHFSQMMAIARRLKGCGCQYWTKVSEADYFVTYPPADENEDEALDARDAYAREAVEKGANLRCISFEEFLCILGVTEEALNEPLPQEDASAPKPKKPAAEKIATNTLGDILKLSGVDISTLADDGSVADAPKIKNKR